MCLSRDFINKRNSNRSSLSSSSLNAHHHHSPRSTMLLIGPEMTMVMSKLPPPMEQEEKAAVGGLKPKLFEDESQKSSGSSYGGTTPSSDAGATNPPPASDQSSIPSSVRLALEKERQRKLERLQYIRQIRRCEQQKQPDGAGKPAREPSPRRVQDHPAVASATTPPTQAEMSAKTAQLKERIKHQLHRCAAAKRTAKVSLRNKNQEHADQFFALMAASQVILPFLPRAAPSAEDVMLCEEKDSSHSSDSSLPESPFSSKSSGLFGTLTSSVSRLSLGSSTTMETRFSTALTAPQPMDCDDNNDESAPSPQIMPRFAVGGRPDRLLTVSISGSSSQAASIVVGGGVANVMATLTRSRRHDHLRPSSIISGNRNWTSSLSPPTGTAMTVPPVLRRVDEPPQTAASNNLFHRANHRSTATAAAAAATLSASGPFRFAGATTATATMSTPSLYGVSSPLSWWGHGQHPTLFSPAKSGHAAFSGATTTTM